MKEEIIFFCTVFGTIITYLAYKASTTDALKGSRTLLLEKFEFLKKINAQLIDDLHRYGNEKDAYNEHFMQGLTLTQCITILKIVKEELLTVENYQAIKKTKSKARIDDLLKGVEAQVQHHSEVRTVIDYYVNPRN